MTGLEQSLLDSLVTLDETVKTPRATSPKPDLMALFSRIDALAQNLPAGTDASLLHYLQKKSYEKARLFLEGRDPENQAGACR